jgi:serine/threonine protein kinase
MACGENRCCSEIYAPILASATQEHIKAPELIKPSALWHRRCGVEINKLSVELPSKECASTLPPCFATEYKVLDKLGAGAFSSVHRAKRLSCGGIVALKTAHLNDAGAALIIKLEYDFLKKLTPHPHIIEALDYNDRTLVLEFFYGLTLQTLCEHRGLPEPNVCDVGAALFRAVAHIHEHKWLHRDVKPHNILVSACLKDLRLIDFNAAASFEAGPPLTPTGTESYKAPEVLCGQPHSTRSDVWASALCIYFSLAGTLPPERKFRSPHARVQLQRSWQPIEFTEDCWLKVTDPCKSMLKGCLAVNPEDRPEMAELLQGELWMRSSDVFGASHDKFLHRHITTNTEISVTASSPNVKDRRTHERQVTASTEFSEAASSPMDVMEVLPQTWL